MLNTDKYLTELLAAVTARTDRQFKVELDLSAGTWELKFKNQADWWGCYATPLYDGEQEGIPVQVIDDGTVVFDYLLFFVPTGDLNLDAAEYVRKCNTIPRLLAERLARKEGPDETDRSTSQDY